MDNQEYISKLESALEALLEEFEPSVDPGDYEIYDTFDDPVQVCDSLAAAVLEAEKLLYTSESEDDSD